MIVMNDKDLVKSVNGYFWGVWRGKIVEEKNLKGNRKRL